MDTETEAPRPRQDVSAAPLRALYACACLLLALLIAGDVSILINLRNSTLRSKAANCGTISLTLAEQANRAMQGLDLILTSLSEQISRAGVVDGNTYGQAMSAFSTHLLLKEKLTGLPYIDAITMIGADGRLLNFSRYWPIPDVNVADRDYFRTMIVDPARMSFLSMPVQNRFDGTWTVFLVRRVQGPDGQFAGLLLGAVSLKYFEDLYRSVWLGPESAVALMRDDGTLLARYPATKAIGQRFPDTEAPPAGGHGPLVTHARTPVDDETRIKASARLPNFPMFVLVTQTEAAALADWRNIAWTLGLITGACVISIVIATLATAHRWRHQQLVGLERAERAEEERARAMSDAELAHERERHAEEASRAKSDFLAMMSHEIRTPMNAVLGLAGTLLDTSLPPQQRRTVEAIRDSGDSLLRLLNDILDFSKLDAGRMTFEDMPFSPAALTRDTVSILGPRATAKGLAITATCAPSLPGTLLGDAGRIRQILLNLVSNAVKFTEAGAVSIEACCPERTSGSASIEWVVSDSGIGIAPDRMASLFGEFIQMDASIHRRFGGSGLGLAICKRLVDQMGGTIDATSCPGQGTVFRVRLKLSLSDQAAHEPPTPADVAAAFAALRQRLGRSPRVLFAEDNPTNQFVALQLLKGVDVQVNVVGDGLEAVDAASSFRYDAIFMDVRMPEMDGLDATRLIRKRGGALARIPIIALTANAFPEDVQACFAAGMDRFVPKPVTRDMLLSVLVSALTAQEPPAEPIPPPAGNPAAPATLDTAFLDEMVDSIGGDGVAEMVALFARETRDRLARLAVPIDDPNVLGREVHTLKGGARTVGASHLAELAAAAEARVKQGDMPSPTALAPLAEAFEIWLIAIQARIPEAARAA